MAIQGIIFDLDGVIVFTDRLHFRSWQKLAKRLGIPFRKKDNDRLRGVSRLASLDILLQGYRGSPFSQQQKEGLAEEKNSYYLSLLAKLTPADVDPKTRNTLAELRKRGYRLALGSSSKNARFILSQVGLAAAFDAIVDGNDIAKAKPDPEVFLKAAAALGLAPGQCAVIEDAAAGLEAAKAGGMLALGIGPAADCPQADARINELSDLLGFPF